MEAWIEVFIEYMDPFRRDEVMLEQPETMFTVAHAHPLTLRLASASGSDIRAH